MKKKPTKRPLQLDINTIRTLTAADLVKAPGGQVSVDITSAHRWC